MNYLMHKTPNGSLYYENEARQQIDASNEISFIHATLSLDDIIRSGRLYPSVGCLGAAVFAVPLTVNRKLHNFTKYIVDIEIPNAQQHLDVPPRPARLLEIVVRSESWAPDYGFNYLYLGPMQYESYREVVNTHQDTEDKALFERFENDILQQIQSARPFLNTCCMYQARNIESADFFEAFQDAMAAMPVLGYIYFEVLSELVQLRQTDQESRRLKALGQLNIRHIKDLVYGAVPGLSHGFDLEKFTPDVNMLLARLERLDAERGLFDGFTTAEFRIILAWRLAQTVRLKLLGKQKIPSDALIDDVKALSGHIIHRYIGEARSMQPYLREYDMARAHRTWSAWNDNNIAFVENAVMPRGEFGINPTLDPSSYDIYEVYADAGGEVCRSQKLDIIMSSKLSGGNLMGSGNNSKGCDV